MTTVWIACQSSGGRCNTYHGKKGCAQLKNARNPRKVDLEDLADSREACPICLGSGRTWRKPDNSYYAALQDAAKGNGESDA